jgi:hypothetical protein
VRGQASGQALQAIGASCPSALAIPAVGGGPATEPYPPSNALRLHCRRADGTGAITWVGRTGCPSPGAAYSRGKAAGLYGEIYTVDYRCGCSCCRSMRAAFAVSGSATAPARAPAPSSRACPRASQAACGFLVRELHAAMAVDHRQQLHHPRGPRLDGRLHASLQYAGAVPRRGEPQLLVGAAGGGRGSRRRTLMQSTRAPSAWQPPGGRL